MSASRSPYPSLSMPSTPTAAPLRSPRYARCNAHSSMWWARERNRTSGSRFALSTTLGSPVENRSIVCLEMAILSLLKFASNTSPLCSAGSGATRFPTSSLVWGSPTPSSPSASAPVPLASRLPGGGCLFLSPRRTQPRARPGSEAGLRPPAWPVSSLGETRVSQVSGPSSSSVPRLGNPAGCSSSSPGPLPARSHCATDGGLAGAFRRIDTLGTREMTFSGLCRRGPHARSPTHRRRRCRRRRKGRCRLAGLGLGRTGFAPAGRRTKFQELPHVFPPLRPALPGRTNASQLGRFCCKINDFRPALSAAAALPTGRARRRMPTTPNGVPLRLGQR